MAMILKILQADKHLHLVSNVQKSLCFLRVIVIDISDYFHYI